MHQQMRESMLHQTLHVRVPSDTQNIHTSDGPKDILQAMLPGGIAPFLRFFVFLTSSTVHRSRKVGQ